MSKRRPELISNSEAATILGISKRSMHRRIQRGLIPADRLAGVTGTYVLRRADVLAMRKAVRKAS